MKVFVTGSSSGIGLMLTEELLRRGHIVWGVSRSRNLLENLATKFPVESFFYSVCDILNNDDVGKVCEEMCAKDFVPDVVVLNAGIYHPDLENLYDHRKAISVFSTNMYGALVWVEQFLPLFLKRGSGQFIAISSILAFRPDTNSCSYPASKAALSMAFRSFRLRYQRTKIKFKSIYFGPVATLIIPRYAKAKKGLFVITTDRAARAIIRIIHSRHNTFYYPIVLCYIYRLTSWISDELFYKLTKRMKR